MPVEVITRAQSEMPTWLLVLWNIHIANSCVPVATPYSPQPEGLRISPLDMMGIGTINEDERALFLIVHVFGLL